MPKLKLHKKPTIDELEENSKKLLDEFEKTEEKETPEVIEEKPETPEEETPETPEEKPEVVEEKPEESEEPEEEAPETPEEPKKPEEKPEEEEKPDYKKRYEDSSREAHILYSKTKKITEVIEKAGDVPEPTEDELRSEYPEWDVMSDFEQKLAKKNMINDRKFDAIGEATKEFKDMETWGKKVDTFLADPETLSKNPALEGKEDEFKVFVSKETRRGVDFADLVSAFLYSEDQKPKVEHKGSMFETGTGGRNEKPKPKSDKINAEESRRLRITDYKKYLEYLKAGKIESTDI